MGWWLRGCGVLWAAELGLSKELTLPMWSRWLGPAYGSEFLLA